MKLTLRRVKGFIMPLPGKLISEDRSTFENQLKAAIKNGKFTKLELCPLPTTGMNQQFKIVSIYS